MTSTIEYLALAAVAIVLVISVVQVAQLSGLNEKVSQQNSALASISGGTNTDGAQAAAAPQRAVQQQATSPSQQMVGGC